MHDGRSGKAPDIAGIIVGVSAIAVFLVGVIVGFAIATLLS